MSRKSNTILLPDLPLVVDLDGTLVPYDLSLALAGHAIAQTPVTLVNKLGYERGRLKTWLWDHHGEALAHRLPHLPWRPAVIAWIESEAAKGRRMVLATGAPQGLAEAVARHFGWFEGVLGSVPGYNMVGKQKAKALIQPYAYVGDSALDLAVWKYAQAAVGVALQERVRQAIACPIAHLIGGSRMSFTDSLWFGFTGFRV